MGKAWLGDEGVSDKYKLSASGCKWSGIVLGAAMLLILLRFCDKSCAGSHVTPNPGTLGNLKILAPEILPL